MAGDSEIVIGVNGTENTYVKSIQYNGTEIGRAAQGRAFLLDRTAPEHSVKIVLSDKGSEISGKVSANDSPVDSAHILLIPWPIATIAGYPSYDETSADNDGRFRFRNLAPGKYRIISIGPAAWDMRDRPNIINAWISVAEEVRVEENLANTVNLECKIL
jgi:hypothetical protein